MIDFKLGGTYQLEQVLSGSGVFDGALLGYATYTDSAGGASFTIRARRLGIELNTVPVRIVLPANNRVTRARWNGTELVVYLEAIAGVSQAQSSDVVHAVNNAESTAQSVRVSDLFVASVVAENLVATDDEGTLTGGMDPTSYGSRHSYAPMANTHGGLFYFENDVPWVLTEIGCRFAGSGVTVSGRIVNVTEALAMVSATEVSFWDVVTTTVYASYGGVPRMIMPGQALLLSAASAGLVRVTARDEARRSNR